MTEVTIEDVVPADALRDIADEGRVRVVTESHEVTGTVTHLHEMDGWPDDGGLTTALNTDGGELLLGDDESSDRLILASARLGFEDEYVLEFEVVSDE